MYGTTDNQLGRPGCKAIILKVQTYKFRMLNPVYSISHAVVIHPGRQPFSNSPLIRGSPHSSLNVRMPIVVTGTWMGGIRASRHLIETIGRVVASIHRAELWVVFIRCVRTSFVPPSCPVERPLAAQHTIKVLLCLVHHCPTLTVHLTDMVPIHNDIQGLHMKKLMGEQSDTLARLKTTFRPLSTEGCSCVRPTSFCNCRLASQSS